MQLSILARFEGEFFLKARQNETNSKKKKEKLKFNRFIEKTMKISIIIRVNSYNPFVLPMPMPMSSSLGDIQKNN